MKRNPFGFTETAADRYLQVVMDGRRWSRTIARANAGALNRNGNADGTLLERGRAGRGECGIADRIVQGTRRPQLREALS